MALTCKECGYPLKGHENSCPECGCPTEFNVNESYTTSPSKSKIIPSQTDNWVYSQYQNGIFRKWHFTCPNKDMASSYDTLNDILLLFNLIFRAIWSLFWPLAIIRIAYYIFVLIIGTINPIDTAIILILVQIVLILGCVFYALVNLIPKVMHKYWVPFHRTWRRINKRYWVNMHKAIESDNINII